MAACPDSKAHGAIMGPIWGQQDPGGTHVGPMNFAIWVGKHWYNLLWRDIVLIKNYNFQLKINNNGLQYKT